MPLQLKNPHSILAALRTRPEDVHEIRIYSGHAAGAWNDVVRLAQEHRISVSEGAPRPTSRRRPKQGDTKNAGRTGAGEASVKAREGVSLKQLFDGAAERREGKGVWLALDCLQDPHNVGAIFRTAAFFGVEGIVVTRDRSAPINSTVYDVASGGLDDIPFTVQTNLSRALDAAKSAGMWALGTSEHASTDVTTIPHDRPWLLVVGNEEKGLRKKTIDRCDEICRLSPVSDIVTSLNVSVATGILMATLCESTK